MISSNPSFQEYFYFIILYFVNLDFIYLTLVLALALLPVPQGTGSHPLMTAMEPAHCGHKL